MAVRAIPVERAPVIKHRSEFFRDGFISMAVIGKSGCGKTEMLSSILDGISMSFSTVLIATVVQAPVHDAILTWFKARGCFTSKTDSPDDLIRYTELASSYGEVTPAKPGLIIFDDFNRGNQSIHCPYWRCVVHCFTKLRNAGWHFIIVAQQPTFLPTIVRNCTTSRVLFDCYTKNAIENFSKDLRHRLPAPEYLPTLIDWVCKVPFSYLLVQEHPFTVSAGKLNQIRLVMDESSVKVPTLRELMKEMGVSSSKELDEKSKLAQLEAGNTASELACSKP